eukprot:CAMPEP_0181084390 /NCGR_PEP_ID=MMETSP1071-20121207/4667_1 /TAXON_ID=35127 /ORGANISM="Thalassiosira sp., Strain NH16" /LENGTH=388 /DNA_ID=CAMNT_0023166115 /DNA_START=170 /DNA_END=1336 /DNA_ORIENTATION=-
MAGPAAIFLPTLKKLYDIENNRDCRIVRERITELDLVVEQVIPSSVNSRAVEASEAPINVPTVVAEIDGKDVKLSGVDDILKFFDDKFSIEKEIKKEDPKEEESEEEVLNQAKDQVFDFISYTPGILRAGRGSSVCSAASPSLSPPRPEKALILYSYEGNQFCRLVREVLTELDITYELRSAGKESPRREELASITGGSSQCPYLIDPNTAVNMAESRDIAEYLYSKYALWTPPNELLRSLSNIITPLLAPLYKVIAPLQAGSYRENEFEYTSDIAEAKAEIYDAISSRPVVIYTYEYSPFCSEAVALLKSTGINYKEVSLGQEWIPGLIKEPAKRAALLDMTGQSSLPNVFVGGTSIGGLYSGNPGLVPALERGELMTMVEEAKKLL